MLNGGVPNLSRHVPFCPRLSSFVLLGAQNGDKSGQKRTNGDKTDTGQIWKRPHLVRVACLQNETAPKSFNFKTKNGPKNDPKLPRKSFKPCSVV